MPSSAPASSRRVVVEAGPLDALAPVVRLGAGIGADAPRQQRWWPRPLAVVGLVGCLALAVSLPAPAVLWGVAVLAVGATLRALLWARASPRR